jgi:hypothetical protein
VKVQAPNRPVLTTQFCFPDEKANLTDEFLSPRAGDAGRRGEWCAAGAVRCGAGDEVAAFGSRLPQGMPPRASVFKAPL